MPDEACSSDQGLCFAHIMGGFPQNAWLPTAFNFAVRHEQSS
jgi:hypothetical protein